MPRSRLNSSEYSLRYSNGRNTKQGRVLRKRSIILRDRRNRRNRRLNGRSEICRSCNRHGNHHGQTYHHSRSQNRQGRYRGTVELGHYPMGRSRSVFSFARRDTAFFSHRIAGHVLRINIIDVDCLSLASNLGLVGKPVEVRPKRGITFSKGPEITKGSGTLNRNPEPLGNPSETSNNFEQASTLPCSLWYHYLRICL